MYVKITCVTSGLIELKVGYASDMEVIITTGVKNAELIIAIVLKTVHALQTQCSASIHVEGQRHAIASQLQFADPCTDIEWK